MTESLRIRIRSDWDAALTYDSLDEKSGDRAVFVGRETLIPPLVAEIVEPNKRGTYLVSGYRGTGKTTLLIEALNRAKEQLAARENTLFPLVLNVSEVSASLGGAATTTAHRLDIDPRRLLVALLRTIDHRLTEMAPKDPRLDPIAAAAHHAYDKATAAKFSQSSARASETSRSRSREWALALEDKNVLKLLAWFSGVAAGALEAVALVGPALGWMHGAALALAGVFVLSLSVSFRRSSSAKESATNQTAAEHDNSLQQLETDLKDILAGLKKKQLRTVVVMEELDKIDDPEGRQLDAVIRYFKNLFTQAPALFFFVTDKSYFDIIASAIKRARRSRSYAVEHTFFTHRLFVGRPTTDESLQFISAIASDDAGRKAVAAVAGTLGRPGRIDEADRFGRFVRVVLFRAANHLFDLKNELRRFVRNEEEVRDGRRVPVSSFHIDDQTFPPEEAALAVFQDLIVEKSRSFEIKGGRAYANETLADCLYSVFNELGSTHPQKVESFLPPVEASSDEGLLLEEQLDLNEAARVRAAVRSLIGDLERGRAFLMRDPVADTFNWRDDAAQAFRYVRQLEKHEESLVAELQRHAALAAPLAVPELAPGGLNPLAQEFEKRVVEVRDAREPMSADAAAAELRSVLDRYGSALTAAFSLPLAELAQYGFVFDQAAQGMAGSLYFVRPGSGDPRLTTLSPRGGVLLAFGETETLADDVWSFMRPPVPSFAPLDRAALVHVIHTTGNVVAEVERRLGQWKQLLAQRAGADADFRFAVDVIALVHPDRDPGMTSAQRIAASLAGFGAWARPDRRAYAPMPIETPPLGEQVAQWIDSDVGLLHIVVSPPGKQSRFFTERDVLEQAGRVVMSLNDLAKVDSVFPHVGIGAMTSGFEHAAGGPDLWEPLGRWLLSSRRVILYVDWQAAFGWNEADVVEALEAGASVIVVTPGSLPPGLAALPHATFPSPDTSSQAGS